MKLSISYDLPERSTGKYNEALAQALLMPDGGFVRLDFDDLQAAKSARTSVYQHIKSKGYDVQVYMRGRSVFIGRQEEAARAE